MKKLRTILPTILYIILAGAGALCGSVSSALADYELTLAWDESVDAHGYRLFMHTEGEYYDPDDPLWEGTQLACTVTALNEGVTYFFVVRAVDAEGRESADSNEVRYPPDSGGGDGGGGGCFIASAVKDVFSEPAK